MCICAPIFVCSSTHILNVVWPWFKSSITKRNKEQGSWDVILKAELLLTWYGVLKLQHVCRELNSERSNSKTQCNDQRSSSDVGLYRQNNKKKKSSDGTLPVWTASYSFIYYYFFNIICSASKDISVLRAQIIWLQICVKSVLTLIHSIFSIPVKLQN